MKLAFPHALWLLALVPALLALAVRDARSRRARLARLGEVGLLTEQTVGLDEGRRLARRIVFAVAFAVIVVGLAGPRFGERTELMPRRGLDLVFAVDVSRSMRARDVRPDRLERAKAEISFALDRLGENRVGLIAFAGSAFVQAPLTTDTEALRSFIGALAPENAPQGGTALAEGLHTAANLFENEERAGTTTAGRLLVVVTDGEDHEGGLEEAAERLQKLGVRTIFIGVGSGLGEPIPVVDEDKTSTRYVKDNEGNTVMTRMSPEVLEEAASLTGGRFLDGTAEPALGLDQVEALVSTLEKRDLEARVKTTYVDRASWPLGLGLLLLLFSMIWPERRSVWRPVAVTGLLLALPLPAAAEEPRGFSRVEPHLEEGLKALRSGDVDGAVEAYRRAEAAEREDRAVVEYNVGAALLQKARALKEAQEEQAAPEGGAAPAPGGPDPEVKEVLGEAEEALERARSLSSSRQLRSDAALAQGNARAEGGDLQGAVDAYREAVVADPKNGRARHNLKAALRMLAMQPPQQSEGGESDEDQEQDGDEEQEGDQQQQGDQQQDQQQQDGEQQDQQQDGEQQEQQQQDGEQRDQPQDGQQQDDKEQDEQQEGRQGEEGDEDEPAGGQQDPSDEKKGEEKDQKAAGQGKEEDLSKEDARRILDALRQREQPLNPFSMRGQKSTPRRVEKDW